MKKILTVFLAAAICSAGAQAQIYTVNNNAGYSANFNNLQTAINTVPAGSVLIVQGSGSTYGDVTLNKQLVLLGPGYNLNANPEPHTQADRLSASIGTLRIKAAASGAIVSGIQLGNLVRFDTVNNILFQSNLCQQGIQLDYSNNINISKCHLKSVGGFIIISTYNSTGMQIRNCLLDRGSGGTPFIDAGSQVTSGPYPSIISVLAEYNTFIYDNGSNASSMTAFGTGFWGPGPSNTVDFTIRNNIFANKQNSPATRDFTYYASPYATFNLSNNIMHDSSFNTTTAAVNNINPATLFQYWGNSGYANDYRCRNAANSPAIGAGTGGSTCGMYGGTEPYSISGLNIVPNIYYLQMPAAGTTGYGIDVHIKAKAN